MNSSLYRTLSVVTLAAAALAVAACSGSTTTPTTPPSTTPSVLPTALPSPVITPSPGASSCRYGKGTVDTFCTRQVGAYGAAVDEAITQLVQQRPDIFDMTQHVGENGYKVLNPTDYYAGVIRNLEARGYCAGYDFVELQLKNSNSFSEQYDIMLGSGHIRRGTGAYRSTCSPPNFPLDAEDVIDHVRVGFFSVRCIDGVPPPRNGENLLLMGCSGFVTASPKNKNGDDIDARIHGDKIDWTLEQEEPSVRVEDYTDVTFNKTVHATQPGHFKLCATVKGVKGCLNGEVKDNALP